MAAPLSVVGASQVSLIAAVLGADFDQASVALTDRTADAGLITTLLAGKAGLETADALSFRSSSTASTRGSEANLRAIAVASPALSSRSKDTARQPSPIALPISRFTPAAFSAVGSPLGAVALTPSLYLTIRPTASEDVSLSRGSAAAQTGATFSVPKPTAIAAARIPLENFIFVAYALTLSES